MNIKRGDLFLVDWSPGRGSEQAGVRPALIIQNDIGNAHSSTTIVAALTTSSGKHYPFQVPLSPEESGLQRPSTVLLEQIITIDKGRLLRRIGRLSKSKMNEVDKAIHVSLGLSW